MGRRNSLTEKRVEEEGGRRGKKGEGKLLDGKEKLEEQEEKEGQRDEGKGGMGRMKKKVEKEWKEKEKGDIR